MSLVAGGAPSEGALRNGAGSARRMRRLSRCASRNMVCSHRYCAHRVRQRFRRATEPWVHCTKASGPPSKAARQLRQRLQVLEDGLRRTHRNAAFGFDRKMADHAVFDHHSEALAAQAETGFGCVHLQA